METHMRPLILATILSAGLAGCSSTAATDAAFDNQATATVRVTVEKTSYTRDELTAGVRGKIINDSDRTVYARLGDAFNSAVEQDPVYIATGSDGALERSGGSNWTTVETAVLVEGVKVIELRAGREYAFIAPTSTSTQAGTYRISVTYRATAGGDATGRASSASFEIK
jgi:hypothetical protein